MGDTVLEGLLLDFAGLDVYLCCLQVAVALVQLQAFHPQIAELFAKFGIQSVKGVGISYTVVIVQIG